MCLRETKISTWTPRLVADTLGPNFEKAIFDLQNCHTTTNTVSADVVMRADDTTWTVTGVYGPQGDEEKLTFLKELKGLKSRGKDGLSWEILT